MFKLVGIGLLNLDILTSYPSFEMAHCHDQELDPNVQRRRFSLSASNVPLLILSSSDQRFQSAVESRSPCSTFLLFSLASSWCSLPLGLFFSLLLHGPLALKMSAHRENVRLTVEERTMRESFMDESEMNNAEDGSGTDC